MNKENDIYGCVHSIEPVGAHDGPGLRTVVFLSGCPMRCKYCHNPDAAVGGGARMSAKEVVDRCLKDRAFTNGVTLSGGEPAMQRRFALEILKSLKRRRIHTALDTSGSVYDEEILKACSLVILDIKHTDAAAFENLCMHGADNTFKTLAYLKKNRIPFWVRQVIVPGITDGEENLKNLAQLSVGAEKVELLPYHTMGIAKWEKLGLDYPLKGVPAADDALMKKCNEIFSKYSKGE
ncbi:MAG: pyruvate formate lyase-activating protein [Clostridia bacterium]|nr:pyruvate formate lyase-activating protein [Clostridia bacterium]